MYTRKHLDELVGMVVTEAHQQVTMEVEVLEVEDELEELDELLLFTILQKQVQVLFQLLEVQLAHEQLEVQLTELVLMELLEQTVQLVILVYLT